MKKIWFLLIILIAFCCFVEILYAVDCTSGQLTAQSNVASISSLGTYYTTGGIRTEGDIKYFCGRYPGGSGWVACRQFQTFQYEYSWVPTGRQTNGDSVWWTFENSCPIPNYEWECDEDFLDYHCVDSSTGVTVDDSMCQDLEPPFCYCYNGKIDPMDGELAIDCGGNCGDCPEELFCPENTSIFWTPVVTGLEGGDIEVMECAHTTSPDQYGNCPPGYSTVTDLLPDGSPGPDDGRCGTHVAFASIYESDGSDTFNPTVPDSSGSFSVVEQVYPEVSETDPVTGNTTTTQTSTTTKTDSNGNTITEEKTRIIVTDSSGNVVSDTTQTNYDGPAYSDGDARLLAENVRIAEGVEGIQDTLDDALTTDTPLDGYGDFDGLIPEDLMPEENDIKNLIDGWISNSPISAYIASLEIQEVNPTACISGSVFGEPISICFDEPHFQDFYALFRGLLISLAYISGAIYLMRKAG